MFISVLDADDIHITVEVAGRAAVIALAYAGDHAPDHLCSQAGDLSNAITLPTSCYPSMNLCQSFFNW